MADQVEPLPFVKISDPTIEMTFSINDSPFAGREGKYVTSRNLRDRLQRELLKDVSLHVKEVGTDSFNVAGRGEMHLSILIETMRREGYEFQVSTPHVLNKEIDGKLCEPIERMVADVPENSVGSVIDKMAQRKGELVSMTPIGSRMRLEFLVPTRGLFGYRNEFLTDTRGEGIMASTLETYEPVKGDIERRLTGSLVAFETGEACAYGLGNVQDRGTLFIAPGAEVYAGMIVGQCNRNEDMSVNVCKKKQLTNMRAAGSGRGNPSCAAEDSVSGTVHGVSRRRRAARGHAQEPSHAQAHSRPLGTYARRLQGKKLITKANAFVIKGCASTARIICAAKPHKFHTCEARSMFTRKGVRDIRKR